MKNKLISILIVTATLLLLGLATQAQQSQPSIEQQIKQKEAELERLKEIKKRQDKVRELQDEIRRLENGQNVPTNEASESSSPQPDASPSPVLQNTVEQTAPQEESQPISSDQPAVMAPRSMVPLNSASPSALPTLRSCASVRTLSADAVAANAPNPTSLLERYFCRKVNQIKAGKKANPAAGLDLRRDFFSFMIVLLARDGRAQYVLDAENDSVDTQVGSDASSSGSTSLVTKGSVPAILGFAVDNGGLLKSANGSTITFRGNVAGLAKALAGKGFISGYDEDSAATRFLRRTAFSFSFDAARGDLPGTFTGNKQQLSSYSVHVDLYNKREPRLARYRDDWKNFLSNQSEPLANQIQVSLVALTDPSRNTWNDPALQAWYAVTDNAIQHAKEEEVEAVFVAQLSQVPENLSDSTVSELRNFDTRFKGWLDTRQGILDKIAKAPIVSFEYINDRPLNEPTLSKFNMIAELGFGSKLDLTFNGALTIFNKKPTAPGVNRVRDFQFATQLDMPFGEIGLGMGKPVLSFAGRYERLMADATLAGLTVPNTQGDIGVGQIKLVIPIKDSGVRIPFSFSFANRTELIREKEVRGNFGFTFDLDTIFAKFKPF